MATTDLKPIDDESVQPPQPPKPPLAATVNNGMVPGVSTPLRPGMTTADTVQGQMSGLLDSNSPYLQRARYRADADMNSKGLINSSMAAGAREAAAIDASLPIAQQDAQGSFEWGMADKAHGQAKELQEQQIQGNLQLQEMKNLNNIEIQKMRDEAAKMGLNAEMGKNYAATLMTFEASKNAEIMSIQQREGLKESEKQKAIDKVNKKYRKTRRYTEDIYRETNDWTWDFL